MSYATRSSPFSFYDPKRKRKEEETCAGRTITDYITDRTFIHIVLWEGKRKCEMCKTDICKVIRVAIIGRIYASRCNAIWSKERKKYAFVEGPSVGRCYMLNETCFCNEESLRYWNSPSKNNNILKPTIIHHLADSFCALSFRPSEEMPRLGPSKVSCKVGRKELTIAKVTRGQKSSPAAVCI